jgi:hypothetical protein
MKRAGYRHLIGGCVAAALLGGCTGSQAPFEPAGAAAARSPVKSWLAPDAKKSNLLYVVVPTINVQGTVNLYSYPAGNPQGQITDLDFPGGDCTDAKGDVYVTDGGNATDVSTIVEYAHGSVTPIRTLTVPSLNPFSCAVDPSSGDLAVTSLGNQEAQGANVTVFPKGTGSPQSFTDPDLLDYYYCTYDNAGDLFVEGHYQGGYQLPKLAELSNGGKSLQTLSLSYEPGWLSSVQWDGKYLAVGQAVKPYIFRYTISGTLGTLAGSTQLSDATDSFQFVFARKRAIVANIYFQDRYIYRYDILTYDYPKGGHSTEQLFYNTDLIFDSLALSRHK